MGNVTPLGPRIIQKAEQAFSEAEARFLRKCLSKKLRHVILTEDPTFMAGRSDSEIDAHIDGWIARNAAMLKSEGKDSNELLRQLVDSLPRVPPTAT
jgi:hypothetical protein